MINEQIDNHRKLIGILFEFGNNFDSMNEDYATSLCADGIVLASKLLARIKELENNLMRKSWDV